MITRDAVYNHVESFLFFFILIFDFEGFNKNGSQPPKFGERIFSKNTKEIRAAIQ